MVTINERTMLNCQDMQNPQVKENNLTKITLKSEPKSSKKIPTEESYVKTKKYDIPAMPKWIAKAGTRTCEKFFVTLDDGSVIYYTRKEYEKQCATDKILQQRKKAEEKQAKLCKPKRTYFRKKKVHCTFEKDLTSEGVEPNPGPAQSGTGATLCSIPEHEPIFVKGLYTYCHNCSYAEFLGDYIKPVIFYRNECKNCMLMAQGHHYFGLESTYEDIKERFGAWLYHGKNGQSFLSNFVCIPRTYERHVNLIEDIGLLLYQFVRSRNHVDRCIAIVNFCKLRGNRINILGTLLDLANSMFARNDYGPSFESDIMNRMNFAAQDDDNIFSQLRGALSTYDKLKEMAIFKKLHKFFMYILCSGMLDGTKIDFKSLQFDKFEVEALKRAHKPGIDMVHAMLDTILFVCEAGHDYFTTGNYDKFIHSGSTYETWLKTANKLKMQSKFLSNPEPHGFNRFSFVSELKDSIEKGKSIVRFTGGLEKGEKLYLQKILCELQLIEAEETTKRSAQQPRKDPFGILIHGSSHIAKSKLTEIMFKHYGKCFDLPIEDNYRYTRCPTDEYWSGFDSTQWCIVMDDIAFLAPTGEVDPTLKELLQVKNSVPYTPPQAALEDKGRTPVKAELLIATTNTKHLNLHAYFACPFAIARRLSFVVTPTVKPQYTKDSFMVDSKLIPPTPEGEYMDIWNFTVSVPRPESSEAKDNQRTRYEVIEKFEDIESFLQWYIFVAEEHARAQEKAETAAKTMHSVEVCKGCKRTTKHCLCGTEWDHIYKRCNLCDNLESSCICSFSEQVETDDFNTIYRLKLRMYSAFAEGEILPIPQQVLDFCESWDCYRYPMILLWFCSMLLHPGVTLCVMAVVAVMWAMRYFAYIGHFYFQWKYGFNWRFRMLFSVCGNEIDTYRLLFRIAGEKAQKIKITRNRLYGFGLFLALPTTLIVLRKLWHVWCDYNKVEEKPVVNHVDMKSQGNTGSDPIPMAVEKKTFYYHDPYATTPCEISGASKCAQSNNFLKDRVSQNTARFNLRFPDVGRNCWTTAVNFHGCLWLLNKHCIKGQCGILDVILDDTTMNVSRNMMNISFTDDDFTIIPDSDLVIIELRAISPGKSILQYFPLDDVLGGRYKGSYQLISKSGVRSAVDLSNVHRGMCPVFGVPGYFAQAVVPTSEGDCGSLCVANVGTAEVILGSHTSGSEAGGVFFQHISQRVLKLAMEKFVPQVLEGSLPISAPGYDRELVPLHNKSCVRFLETGTAKVYGSFAGYRPKHKSKIVPTFICDYVVEHGYKADFGKPCMDWQPWHLAIKDMTTPVHCYYNSNIKLCEDAFFNDIHAKIKDQLHLLQIYSLDVALNGSDGITYVDKINCSTSAGNPVKRTKKAFITQIEGKITEVDDLIMNRVKDIENCYDNSTRYHPQFCGHLKDEPTSNKKIAAGKTRVFTGGEFAWSIVVRKYLLSHIRLIQNNPFVFEAMPGVVAQSTEWRDLHEFIVHFGEHKIVAGDYGKFDKRMAAPFILSAFRILERLAQSAGWPEEDLRYIRCISYDTAFPCIDFNGDLIEIQGNPSGHPLTVIINCLVNSLYMRYAYMLISGKPIETFQDNVHLATYGDDNIMGVSDDCPNFNHTRIAAAMKCIGVEYTMAEKEAASVPYINMKDASFLKRAFVFDKDVGCIVAPLDESSFHKMLTARLPKDDMAAEAHAICVIETAQREYFFHGKEVFLAKQKFFHQLVIDCGLQSWVRDSTFPDYYDMIHEFWMRFDDVENAKKYSRRETTLQTNGDNRKPSQGFISQGDVKMIGQHVSGKGSRLRSSCCSSELDQVTVPSPVCSVVSSSSVEEMDLNYDLLELGKFLMQSEVAAMGTTEEKSVQEEAAETVTFLEKANRYSTGFSANLPPGAMGDATMGADLHDFLSRPVLINTYTWNESDPIGTTVTLNPWQLFFNTTSIKNKMTNYAWLKCDLKIKILVNASPFYYGTTLVSYHPLPNFHQESIVRDGGTRFFIPYSQRPHIWVYPQNNEGGEMTLPFMWPKNWLSTLANSDFVDMGSLTYFPVVALQSANGVTAGGVTISTYAWAENVVLSGPTAGFVMQSDEYSSKPVSSIATAVSKAAGALSGLPVIGKFMTATQIGAKAVASVAASLGFSNPPVIDNAMPVKIQGLPQLASPEISYPIEKLTLDPKNELTVDPSVAGLPSNDELSIQHLVGKESYITTFNWSYTDAPDALLFNSAVTPVMFDLENVATKPMYMTPMGWLSNMFTNWRGDVIFRFRFICSQYHRGRVRIIYDPSGSSAANILNVVGTQSTVFNEVVDLTKDTNVEVRVPYQQALAWCKTFNPTSVSQVPFTIGNSTLFNHQPGFSNGLIAVRVVTGLTAPVLATTIQCIVSVRGAENLEFSNPSDIYHRYSYFAAQSDEYEETECVSVIAGHGIPKLDPNRYLVNFGEQIVSVRQMLRRFQYYRTTARIGSNSAAPSFRQYKLFKLPPFYGYSPSGWDSAKGLITPANNYPINMCGTTYLHWVIPAFIGQRGSINYSLVQDCPQPTVQFVSRQPNIALGTAVYADYATSTGSDGIVTIGMKVAALVGAASSGMSGNSNFAMGSINWQMPNYSAYKFNVSTPVNFNSHIGQDDSDQQSQVVLLGASKTTSQNMNNHWFLGAGTDFMPVFFLNVPTIFVYSGDPVVN